MQSFYQRIEEKLSIISDEKHDLEDILKQANSEHPGDENVFRLYEKYVELFKETVSLNQEVHVDDFSQDDHENNEGGPEKDEGGPSKDGAKKDVDGDDAKKDGNVDGAKKDGNVDGAKKDDKDSQKDYGDNVDGGQEDGDVVDIVRETENPVEDSQDEDIIDVGSFTQWLEENYDVVGDVIDIISEVYYDVLYLS